MSAGWKIWKFELPTNREEFPIAMPAAINLTMQMQNGSPVLWAAVIPATADEEDRQPRWFRWIMTGHPIADDIGVIAKSYVGTAQLPDGIVLHLFQLLDHERHTN